MKKGCETMENKKTYKISIITLAVIFISVMIVYIVAGNKQVETLPMTEPTISESEPCMDVPFDVDKKPIIYIYPSSITEVSVKLGHPENITCSYPEYDNGWTVIASPNGDLVDVNTNRNLYSLYYEANIKADVKVSNTGFVVARNDTIKFLEEKLAILGLTEHAAQEFIIYWLPILEQNEYNYVYFATKEEIDSDMPLSIEPAPDTIIRVRMYFCGLDAPIQVKEQDLIPVRRLGYTVVEWGGIQLESITTHRVKAPHYGPHEPTIEMRELPK